MADPITYIPPSAIANPTAPTPPAAAPQATTAPTPQISPTYAPPSPPSGDTVGNFPANPVSSVATGSSGPGAPSANVPQSTGTGDQGQNVEQLQNWLVQMGYLTPQQVASGPGVYGPQTTAAVAKLQQSLGINPSGQYNPQTQQALGQKYQNAFASLNSSQAPNSAAAANTQIQNISQTSTDPVFGAMTAQMQPILNSLTQVLNNINDPAVTGTSLQQEYNTIQQQYGLPDMQASLLNMQNVMNGTTDDIRSEITSAGGQATESQIQGMSSARNTVILKQYNALATQYQAAQTNVQNMMQYVSTDQQTKLQQEQIGSSVAESIASFEQQMVSMGMTMQQNTIGNLQYNVTQMGYKGLAASAQGNPQVLGSYENLLGLPPGSLSNPATVAQLDTYKDQTIQLNNYKAAIAAYNAGYKPSPPKPPPSSSPSSPSSPTSPASVPAIGITPVDPTTLVRPSYIASNVPLIVSADTMSNYMTANKASSVDPGTNNIVAPGLGYYLQQSDGSYVLQSSIPQGVDKQYEQVKQTIAAAPVFSGSPTVTRKWTLAANSAISSFQDSGTYKVLSNVAPYLAAIQAAAANPGDKSVSDFELLDSFVKASKGGSGQVTDSQVNIQLQGASLGDRYDILEQKLQQGGVLSTAQRTALISLAEGTFKENAEDYKNIYVQATQAMQGEGIPVQFWRNLPDFTTLVSQSQPQ